MTMSWIVVVITFAYIFIYIYIHPTSNSVQYSSFRRQMRSVCVRRSRPHMPLTRQKPPYTRALVRRYTLFIFTNAKQIKLQWIFWTNFEVDVAQLLDCAQHYRHYHSGNDGEQKNASNHVFHGIRHRNSVGLIHFCGWLSCCGAVKLLLIIRIHVRRVQYIVFRRYIYTNTYVYMHVLHPHIFIQGLRLQLMMTSSSNFIVIQILLLLRR